MPLILNLHLTERIYIFCNADLKAQGTILLLPLFPRMFRPKDIIFTANRYISNGLIQNISHIVYIIPERYSELSELDELKTVGRIVGALNAFLPKRQFILIGPGRWEAVEISNWEYRSHMRTSVIPPL